MKQMQKMFLVLLMVFALTGVAFAGDAAITGDSNTYTSTDTSTNTYTGAGGVAPGATAPSRVAVGSAPQDSGQTELNFIAPNERDVTTILPSFGCGTIKRLVKTDCIVAVVWQSNDIKFKDLYKEVLKGVRSDEVMKSTVAIRYQIWEAASSKSWTTGGNLSGNGIGQTGTALIGGSAGIFPQMGRSKSSNLYTIIFVQVQEFK